MTQAMEAPMTQQEVNTLLDFWKRHNICWVGDDGDHNGVLFGDALNQWADQIKVPKITITEQVLQIIFKKLQDTQAGLLYYTPDETQYWIFNEQYPEQMEAIRKFLPTHRLSTEDQDLFVNANTIMSWCVRTGRAENVTPEMLHNIAIGNLANQPRVDLRWTTYVPKKVREEREARELETKLRHIERLEFEKRNSPEGLKQAQQQHLDEAKQFYQATWKRRVEDYIRSIPSNNLRARAQQEYGNNPAKDWEKTFRHLDTWVQRQKNPHSSGLQWAR